MFANPRITCVEPVTRPNQDSVLFCLNDEITKKAFEDFAALVVRSVSMRNADIEKEKVAEVVS